MIKNCEEKRTRTDERVKLIAEAYNSRWSEYSLGLIHQFANAHSSNDLILGAELSQRVEGCEALTRMSLGAMRALNRPCFHARDHYNAAAAYEVVRRVIHSRDHPLKYSNKSEEIPSPLLNPGLFAMALLQVHLLHQSKREMETEIKQGDGDTARINMTLPDRLVNDNPFEIQVAKAIVEEAEGRLEIVPANSHINVSFILPTHLDRLLQPYGP